MKRVKELISEADVVKRNPLRPTYHKNQFDGRDTVVVTDMEDDIDTLHGRINARGRAEELRRTEIDDVRVMAEKREALIKCYDELERCEKVLEETASMLDRFGDYDSAKVVRDAHYKVRDAYETVDEHIPSHVDIDFGSSLARRPIVVGGGYARH